MIDIKKYINEIVSDALTKLNVQSNIIVEKSSNPSFGDYSTNIALSLAKKANSEAVIIPMSVDNTKCLIGSRQFLLEKHNLDWSSKRGHAGYPKENRFPV